MYYQQRKLPLIVKKSNEMVRTQLSVENNSLANKLFITLVRHLNEGTFPEVACPVNELFGEDGRAGGDDYRRVKKAAEVLLKARLDSLEHDQNGKEVGFHMFNLFGSCKYKNGEVIAKFNPDLKGHLLGLKEYFTPLNYFELIELSSFYSQRLYELLKSWENPTGLWDVQLDALYDLLSFPVNMRTNFKEFRKRALEQAEKDINEKTGLKFRWEPIKEGRKVVAIRFVIGEQGQRSQNKRQTKEAQKERQEKRQAADRRKPHLEAARQCRIDHGMKGGDICKLAKPRSKKCQLCAQTAGVAFYCGDLFTQGEKK